MFLEVMLQLLVLLDCLEVVLALASQLISFISNFLELLLQSPNALLGFGYFLLLTLLRPAYLAPVLLDGVTFGPEHLPSVFKQPDFLLDAVHFVDFLVDGSIASMQEVNVLP